MNEITKYHGSGINSFKKYLVVSYILSRLMKCTDEILINYTIKCKRDFRKKNEL